MAHAFKEHQFVVTGESMGSLSNAMMGIILTWMDAVQLARFPLRAILAK
jgi:hypothetical protein